MGSGYIFGSKKKEEDSIKIKKINHYLFYYSGIPNHYFL